LNAEKKGGVAREGKELSVTWNVFSNSFNSLTLGRTPREKHPEKEI